MLLCVGNGKWGGHFTGGRQYVSRISFLLDLSLIEFSQSPLPQVTLFGGNPGPVRPRLTAAAEGGRPGRGDRDLGDKMDEGG